MPSNPPRYQAEQRRVDALREAFASEFEARRIKWSAHNLSRLLRLTGERLRRL